MLLCLCQGGKADNTLYESKECWWLEIRNYSSSTLFDRCLKIPLPNSRDISIIDIVVGLKTVRLPTAGDGNVLDESTMPHMFCSVCCRVCRDSVISTVWHEIDMTELDILQKAGRVPGLSCVDTHCIAGVPNGVVSSSSIADEATAEGGLVGGITSICYKYGQSKGTFTDIFAVTDSWEILHYCNKTLINSRNIAYYCDNDRCKASENVLRKVSLISVFGDYLLVVLSSFGQLFVFDPDSFTLIAGEEQQIVY